MADSINVNEPQMFKSVLALVGHTVTVTLRSTGIELRGKVINAMFDSLLLHCGDNNHVVRFDDIYTLDPITS